MSTAAALSDALARYAFSLPAATEDHPWGETVAKVQGKVFVFLGRPDPVDGVDRLGFSVKLPESGAAVLAHPWASPTGYGLGRAGWVSVRVTADEAPDLDTMCAWIRESYRAVAPKRLGRQVA